MWGTPLLSCLGPALDWSLDHHFPLQNVASQAPQSLPAISQPPQSSTMGYVGSQSVSLGYQPYSMQVRSLLLTTALHSRALLEAIGSHSWALFHSPQNLMTTLPGQDASLPPQQPYIAGQQPVYQQVRLSQTALDFMG